MKVTLAQLNPTVGDIKGNLEKIPDVLDAASVDLSDLVVLPELFLVGYPPRDLLKREWFIKKVEEAIGVVAEISSIYPETGILFGAPVPVQKEAGHRLYNSAVLAYQGKILHYTHKSLLPTYDVFDEGRYFDPADDIDVVPFKDEILGISICEDAWNDKGFWPRPIYSLDPIAILARKGATLLVNISGSPFYLGKEKLRFDMVRHHAMTHKLPFVFVNQVGANDELIFDGRSFALDSDGNAITVLSSYCEHLETIDTRTSGTADRYSPEVHTESAYEALVLGVRDYLRKCGFNNAVIGLSGGIDSAVVACIAADAIGADNVLGVAMPSRFSKPESTQFASKLADSLGIHFDTIPIEPMYEAYHESLHEQLEFGDGVEVTLENIQARIRGNILMAISNKFGHLVLSTGNKSELAVGYSTLYGDMSGGLAVISDVPKTLVYEIARYINRDKEVIPEWIIERPPSAELRPDQLDQDTLPPYEILDKIIHHYVDLECSISDIINEGFDPATVQWVVKTIDRNEYKRRQAAPGLKITSKAFGMGRRMPIAAKYGD
jgi:NAD+ synthase (glutamine-hydrolysing)